MSTPAPQSGAAIPAPYFDPGDKWVPADQRWFGMDRRTLLPALAVLALAFLQGVLLPRIDAAMPVTDVTTAGDVIAVRTGITFTAPAGWSLTAGERRRDEPTGQGYPAEAVLTRGGVQFVVRAGDFTGSPAALLAQIKRTDAALKSPFTATGEPVPIRTRTGEPGVISKYAAASLDGVLAAFIVGQIGVEVVAVGPAQTGRDILTEVGQMIASISRAGQETT